MIRAVGLGLLVALASGCKQHPSEQARYVEELTGLCYAQERAPAKDASELFEIARARARTPQFKQELSVLQQLSSEQKILRLAEFAGAAGLPDCPFMGVWKHHLADLAAADAGR